MKQEISDQRREQRRKQSVHTRHADGKRHIAAGKVGDDIACGTARTRADKHHPSRESRVEMKRFAQKKCQQRHDRKLRETSGNDIPRAGKDNRKILGSDCQSHPEHHRHQKIVDPRKLNP